MPISFERWIFSFHIPLFIILSGMAFTDSLKNVKSLLICSLTGSLVGSLAWIMKEPYIGTIKNSISGILGGSAAPFYRLQFNPAIWFLSALVVIEILYMWSRKNNILFIIFLLGLPFLGTILALHKANSYLPWNIDVAFLLYPFFWFGNIIKKYDVVKRIYEQCNKMQMVIFVTVMLLSLIQLKDLNGNVNIYRCVYGNSIFLYYINGIIGGLGIIFLSYQLSLLHRISEWLKIIGKNTLVIMCYHQITVFLCLTYISHLNGFVYCYLKYFFFIVMIIGLTVSSIFINKYMPWFIGKGMYKRC